jgi:competence protein ComEC
MHVGLIFTLITGIAHQILNKKRVKQFGVGFVLPLIWLFAAITGSSASIVRSAWMFSSFLLAQVIYRKNNNLNSLGLSGFIMLSLNPDWLFGIGFQLSFAAVGSLLLYQKVFAEMIKIEHKIIKWIWNIAATTLAAQILTLPFLVYHFKSFPLLFLISNLLVVPLSSIILILLIILLLFSPLPVLANSLGQGIDLLMLWMNKFVVAMDQIPFTQLHLYTWKLSSCCILALLLNSFFQNPWKLKTSKVKILLLVALLVGDLFWQERELHQTNKMYILQKTGTSMLIHQHGGSGEITMDSSSHIKNHGLKKLTQNLSKELGVRHWKIRILSNSMQLLQINSTQRTCLLEKSFELIRKGADIRFYEYQNHLIHHFLVADGSNKVWKIKEWQSHAQQVNLPFYSTPEKGCISMDCRPFPRR